MINYKQCRLKKGNTQQVSWIPSKFAKLNKVLKLKTADGWDDGWMVESAGSFERTEAEALARRDDYRNQRACSDV